jgi:hypothetical protein
MSDRFVQSCPTRPLDKSVSTCHLSVKTVQSVQRMALENALMIMELWTVNPTRPKLSKAANHALTRDFPKCPKLVQRSGHVYPIVQPP